MRQSIGAHFLSQVQSKNYCKWKKNEWNKYTRWRWEWQKKKNCVSGIFLSLRCVIDLRPRPKRGRETLLCNCWRHTRQRRFDRSSHTETTTIGLCFLVDMAECVRNNTVFTCWYTLLSTFTLSFPQTAEPFTIKLFTLWTENVSENRRLTVSEDPTVHMLHLGVGGRVHTVLQRVFSSPLECFTLVALFFRLAEVINQSLRVCCRRGCSILLAYRYQPIKARKIKIHKMSVSGNKWEQ